MESWRIKACHVLEQEYLLIVPWLQNVEATCFWIETMEDEFGSMYYCPMLFGATWTYQTKKESSTAELKLAIAGFGQHWMHFVP